MRATILECFNDALQDYQNQESRGYPMGGLFSSLRHSTEKYPALQELEELINSSTNENVKGNIQLFHFDKKGATFNNHSFNSYFIDQLCSAEMTQKTSWSSMLNRPVELYQGILYRGTSRHHEAVFADGMTPRTETDSTEDYIEYSNGSVGVSTTKRFETALKYASSATRRQANQYIYVIDYSGTSGYSIVETAEYRGANFINPSFWRRDRLETITWKAEVNIHNGIPKEDIIGAYAIDDNDDGNDVLSFEFIPNENYRHYNQNCENDVYLQFMDDEDQDEGEERKMSI